MRCRSFFALSFAVVCASSLLAATTPSLTLYSPSMLQANQSPNTANYYGDAPIHIVASAISPSCAGGISAFEIYTVDGQLAYETYSSYVDTQLALDPGYYTVDIKVFDNCGGVAAVYLDASVQSAPGTVVVNQPEMNTVYSGPVKFNARSTTTCPAGVSAMGIYTANHQLAYSVNASTVSTSLNLAPGTYDAVVEMWNNCNQAVTTPVTFTVASGGIPTNPEFIYVPRTGSPWIDGFSLQPSSCALYTINGSPFPAHYKPYGTAADPLGVFAFAVNQDSQDVNVYRIDPNIGGLTQVAASPASVPQYDSLKPQAIVVDAKGRFVYVSSGNYGESGSGYITAYSLDRSSGKPTLIPGSPFKLKSDANGNTWANYMAVEATGHHLYTSNDTSVSGFSIDQSTGALTELPNSPYPARDQNGAYVGTSDIIVDPSHTHLYTADGGSNSISGWSIDASTGELSPVPGSPWNDPTIDAQVRFSPTSITIDGQGNYIFGLDSGAEQISIWSVDASTGVVTFDSDQHNGQVDTDPLGKIRAIPGSNCLVDSGGDALAFDPTTGNTTFAPGSPFAVPGSGQGPGIAIAP
jgi:6-phosphogluconolactonase (cycloisomerase 2 family)